MNREDIEHMWKVASNNPNHDTNWHDPVVVAFAALVASAEREACAKVCDDLYKKWVDDLVNDTDDTADSGTPDCVDCAAAIRARGNT